MKFVLSGNLLRFADFQHEITVEGSTLRQGILALAERFPELRQVLLDGQARVRRVFRIFVNRELIAADDLDRPAASNDEISLLTAIAGG